MIAIDIDLVFDSERPRALAVVFHLEYAERLSKYSRSSRSATRRPRRPALSS